MIETRQIVQCFCQIGVLWTQMLLTELEGSLVQCQRLFVFTLFSKDISQSIVYISHIWMFRPPGLFPEMKSSPMKLLGQFISLLLGVKLAQIGQGRAQIGMIGAQCLLPEL